MGCYSLFYNRSSCSEVLLKTGALKFSKPSQWKVRGGVHYTCSYNYSSFFGISNIKSQAVTEWSITPNNFNLKKPTLFTANLSQYLKLSDSHLPNIYKHICFNDSRSKLMKNAFCFILKALFVLKIFKSLSCLFGHVEKTVWLET